MGRGYKDEEEDFQFEGRVEHSTGKAILVDPTVGTQVWVPRSQITSQESVSDDGVFVFRVTAWWYHKNEDSFK